jgi:hypothetical protein
MKYNNRMNKSRMSNFTRQVCGLCKQIIYLTIDDYCNLRDFKSGKFYTEGYYHNKCYRESLLRVKDFEKFKQALLKIFNKNKINTTQFTVSNELVSNELKGGT